MTEAQEAALQWGQHPGPVPSTPAGGQRAAPRLAPGFRWIAVRPGPPPPSRRPRRPLGPTPHYTAIPRWGLMDWPNAAPSAPRPTAQSGPSPIAVHKALDVTTVLLSVAALTQVGVYGLLLVNRTKLLHPVLALAAVGVSRLASLAALVAVITCVVLLTRWLIARRSGAFARQRLPESRPSWALWAGCLVPMVNLAWAPVYAIELAALEAQFPRLRRPIVRWWVVWAVASAAAAFATATSWAQDSQGIANNTVAMAVSYLLGVVAVQATARVVDGFERRGLDRPAHHWVVVAADREVPKAATPAGVLEPDGQEPAA